MAQSDPGPLTFHLTDRCTVGGRYYRRLSPDRMRAVDAVSPRTVLAPGPEEFEHAVVHRDLYDDWTRVDDGHPPAGPDDWTAEPPTDVSYRAAEPYNRGELVRALDRERALRSLPESDSEAVRELLRFCAEVRGAIVRWYVQRGFEPPRPDPPTAATSGHLYAVDARPHLDRARDLPGLYALTYGDGAASAPSMDSFRKELHRSGFWTTGLGKGEGYERLRRRVVEFVDFHRPPEVD